MEDRKEVKSYPLLFSVFITELSYLPQFAGGKFGKVRIRKVPVAKYVHLISEFSGRNEPWLSVPQFGDWDQKGPLPDYSMDFSKIREMRKQNKRDPSRASLGNEEDLISSTTTNAKTIHNDDHNDYEQNHSPAARRSILSCFNCCVKA